MSSDDFRGKVAVISGGSRGIGRATALEFARRGADVAITYYRRRSAACEVVRDVETAGRKGLAVRADFSDQSDVRRVFDTVQAQFGRVDCYVSNAASAFFKPLADLEPFHWDYVLAANLTATLTGCRCAYELMPGAAGAIVLVSSLGSRRYLQRYGALGACKAAVESLGRSLAVEFAPGVNVNTVCGGAVETDSLRAVARSDPQRLEEMRERSPMGRLGTPRDLATVIAFLCTPDANWIRGQTLVVDGGMSLTM